MQVVRCYDQYLLFERLFVPYTLHSKFYVDEMIGTTAAQAVKRARTALNIEGPVDLGRLRVMS